GGGILTAVVTILRLISALLETNPVATYGFFFGLIAASGAVLYGEISLATPTRKAAAIAGFAFAFVVSGVAATAIGSSLPIIFVAGAVAISAMILPGVSGSLLLLVLGQYEYMSTTLSRATDALVAALRGNGTAGLVDTGPPIVVFLSGAVVGLLTISHAVRWALDRYREATLVFLVSLIVGALRAPVEQVEAELGGGTVWTTETLGVFLGVAVVGAATVVVIDRLAGGIETGQVTDFFTRAARSRAVVPHTFEFRNISADLAIFRRPYYDERIPGG
ncbi:MAG: putative membrane protein, partial [Halonotius sp. J07HN6]